MEVIEAAAAHGVRNQAEAAYARLDLFERRRRLMDDWATYLYGKRGQVIALYALADRNLSIRSRSAGDGSNMNALSATFRK